MLISAISANRLAFNYKVMPCNKVSSKGNDNTADKSFNSLQPSNKTTPDKKLYDIYESINEWKTFCHEQILNGKLDIIA